MKKQKNILICPLDWGLGHATRIVPIIELFQKKGANIIIAADNSPLEFLKLRFPNCKTISLKGYETKYPKGKNMAFKMALQLPAMIRAAKKAKLQLEEIIEKHKIDIVISDNRYELSSKNAYSVFMTHQLNIQTKGLQTLFKPLINNIINGYIKKYDELWIPDFEGDNNLSGNLSHNTKVALENHHFVGTLSRFYNFELEEKEIKYEVMAIVSGPEPQRSILEKKLENELLKSGLKSILLCAKPNENTRVEKGNLTIVSHMNDEEFARTIMESILIISRPGYSTIMDLVHFGKKAIFIPTPGQTEQEYLAGELMNKKYYFSEYQQSFSLSSAFIESKDYIPLSMKNDFNTLYDRIEYIINLP